MNFKIVYSTILIISCSCFYDAQTQTSLLDFSQIALSKNPVLKRNVLSVKNAQAEIQVQKSIFDYSLFSNINYQKSKYHLFYSDPRNEYLNKTLNAHNLDFNTGVQKKLITSQIIELGVNYSYNDNNVPFNSYNQQITPFRGDYSGTFNLSITQPLLRGRGKSMATLPVRVSELIVEMVKDQNIFTASNELLQVGKAYWEYYNACRNLEIYQENENRIRNVLEMTKELVNAEKKPAGDLLQIQADLANQEKLTLQARQNWYASQTYLAQNVGMDETEIRKLPLPEDYFPSVEESGYDEHLETQYFLDLALKNRADFAGLQKKMQALELQLELSKNNLKPTLDLSGFAFYGNTSQGNGKSFQVSSLFNTEGRYVGAGAKLTFNFALNNNLAKGNYAKDVIAIEDQRVVTQNLYRLVELSISNALNNLSLTAAAVKKSKEALENYRSAFINEQSKFQAGLTTLLNVILFQERLTGAELEYLRAQQKYAIAIAELRHETGTLLHKVNENISISRDSFYTLPHKINP